MRSKETLSSTAILNLREFHTIHIFGLTVDKLFYFLTMVQLFICRNILRDDTGHLKVADFGVSKLVTVKEDKPFTCLDTSCKFFISHPSAWSRVLINVYVMI